MNEIAEISNRDLFRKFLGKGGLAAAIKILNAGLAYAMTALAARLCDPHDFGIFALLFSTCMTLSLIAPLGRNAIILRYYPEAVKRNGVAGGKAVLTDSAFFVLLGQFFSLLCFTGLIYFSDWVEASASVKGMLFLFSVLLALSLSAGEYLSAALRVLGYTFKALAPRDVFWRLAVCVCGFAAIAVGLERGLSVTTVFGVTSLLSLPFLWLQIHYLRKDLRGVPDRELSSEEKKSMRSSGFYVWGAATLQTITAQAAIYAVTAGLDPEAAGAYFAADRTANLLSLFLMAVSLAALPMISSAYAQGEIEKVKMLSAGVSLVSGGAALIGWLLLYCLGDRVLTVFHPEYAAYFPVLMIVAFGQVFNAMTGPATSFLQILGAEKPYFYACAVFSALFLAGYYFLTPQFGAIGAAWLSTGMLISVKIFAWGYGFFRYGYDLTGFSFIFKKICKISGSTNA